MNEEDLWMVSFMIVLNNLSKGGVDEDTAKHAAAVADAAVREFVKSDISGRTKG